MSPEKRARVDSCQRTIIVFERNNFTRNNHKNNNHDYGKLYSHTTHHHQRQIIHNSVRSNRKVLQYYVS